MNLVEIDEISNESIKKATVSKVPEISDKIFEFMSNFIIGQNARKRIIQNLNQYFQEIAKAIDTIVKAKAQKNKNPYYPRISYLNVEFTSQIYDYTRSLFEVQLKKFDDISKYIK